MCLILIFTVSQDVNLIAENLQECTESIEELKLSIQQDKDIGENVAEDMDIEDGADSKDGENADSDGKKQNLIIGKFILPLNNTQDLEELESNLDDPATYESVVFTNISTYIYSVMTVNTFFVSNSLKFAIFSLFSLFCRRQI